MVQLIHGGENLDKIHEILKVAQRRFGIYGLEKTTMKEIAADLGISKASLYYYYPDKESLFKAVVSEEQEAYLKLVMQTIDEIQDPIVLIKKFVIINLDYFKTFFNLSRLRLEEFRNMKPMLADMLADFRLKEIELTRQMMMKGMKQQLFHIDHVNDVASIFLESMRGLRSLVIHNKEFIYIEEVDYSELEKKLNTFSEIFIRGLMYRAEQI